MKNEVFDDLTRTLASGMPRRQALRYTLGLITGGFGFMASRAAAQIPCAPLVLLCYK
jgi:hypothetical protein